MRILILISLFLLSQVELPAQKFLQMDMFGKKKAMRFDIGDELMFKVKGDKNFYSVPIRDLNFETGEIILPKGQVLLSDIVEIQVISESISRKILGRKLFVFGASFTGIGIFDAVVYGSTFGPIGITVGVVTLMSGILLRWVFKKRTFKVGKKRQLRIIDLNLDDLAVA